MNFIKRRSITFDNLIGEEDIRSSLLLWLKETDGPWTDEGSGDIKEKYLVLRIV